jgi:tRNA threonylcarbamoyladenosine biosynthesis protein TsaB
MHGAMDRQHGPAPQRLLVIETSQRHGLVALAAGDRVLGERRLDEARRHARDLVPFIRELLTEQGWRARELNAVLVSRGPGSYTGLRVGIMSAKTLAYASGCTLVGLETFAALARQAPAAALAIDVIADAQQDRVYMQRFARSTPGEAPTAATPLSILALAAWQATMTDATWVIGPGLERFAAALQSNIRTAPPDAWFPRAESLLQLGLERLRRGQADDLYGAEPLYLRPSSAEENMRVRS